MTTNTQEENLKAFNRLLKEREFAEKQRQGSTRYYADLHGNKFGWFVARQDDGKFHGFIQTKRKYKLRAFRTKRQAKKWAYDNFYPKWQRQVEARKKRKELAELKKPKFTAIQLRIQEYEKKIQQCKNAQIKITRKIKTMNTRFKTYEKRLKYCAKRLNEIITANPNEVKTL